MCYLQPDSDRTYEAVWFADFDVALPTANAPARGKVVAPTPFRKNDYWHTTRKTSLADHTVRTGNRNADTPAVLGETA